MRDTESQTPARSPGLQAQSQLPWLLAPGLPAQGCLPRASRPGVTYHVSPWLNSLPVPERKGSQNRKQPQTLGSAQKLPGKVQEMVDTESPAAHPGSLQGAKNPKGDTS